MVVDAKETIDELFADCSDVVHLVGVAEIPTSDGKIQKVAIARLIFATDGKLRPFTERVQYRMFVEASTGVEMFSIYSPEDPMHPWLVTEWSNSFNEFVHMADHSRCFIFEMYQPSRKHVAFVVDGQVRNSADFEIAPEIYRGMVEGDFEAPPTSARGGSA